MSRILFILGLLFLFGTSANALEASVVCTQDAKLCPDGSGVGRTGPNCEFAPCPGETASGEEEGTGSDTLRPMPLAGCTKELKICPDGSSVGRRSPDCAFTPCPDEISPDETVPGEAVPDESGDEEE